MKSATIIVTAAKAFTRIIHDRMPVILNHRDVGRWLACELSADTLNPAPDDTLRMWPVSRRVSRTGVGDNAKLIEEVARGVV